MMHVCTASVLMGTLAIVSLDAARLAHPIVRAAAEHRERTGSIVCDPSVWDGVYTEEQRKRGEQVYDEACASCHSATLTGGEGSPPLVGDEFLTEWTGKTAADLFERIRTTMPSDSPGRLSRVQYADVLAHIFNANGFPVGQAELGHDVNALKLIGIEATRSGKP